MVRVRQLAWICAAAVVLTAAAFAQNHPDFTGTWTVDHVDVQTQRNPNFDGGGRGGFGGGIGGRGGRGGFGRPGGGGGRGGGGRGGSGRRGGQGRDSEGAGGAGLSQGDVMRISQTQERLIVTRKSPDGEVMTSYSLDGKETKNQPSPEIEIKSKTKWEGVALVTDSTQTMKDIQGEKFSTKTREIMSLSADGQTLTTTMTADSRIGKRTVTATLTRSHS